MCTATLKFYQDSLILILASLTLAHSLVQDARF